MTPARQLRQLTNMFSAAAHGLTEDEIREYGVPKAFLAVVVAECRAIRKMHVAGNLAGARERAREAAQIGVAAFGDELGRFAGPNPRELAREIRGEA